MDNQTELKDFIERQLRARGWSQRELSRQAGVAHSSVGRALDPDAKSPASVDVLLAIAAALRIHPVRLLAMANIIPREPAQTTRLRHLQHVFQQLSEEHQEMIVAFTDYLFTQYRADLWERIEPDDE